MGGFAGFLSKELRESVRTWRLPVIAGVVLLFALSGPVLALYTPELLKSLQSSQPGVVIQLPEPTWADAYTQWAKNLTQIVTMLVLVLAAGSVAGEVSSNTAILVLTKPVSRSAFVVAKAIASWLLVGATVAVGTAATQLITYAVFGRAPAAPLWAATGVWFALATLLIAVTTAFSAMMPTLAAAGAGIGAFFALSLLALWGPAARNTAAGLTGAMGELLARQHPALAWPLATAAVGTLAAVGLGCVAFSRREL